MKCSRIESIVHQMGRQYAPFNILSAERFNEISEIVRVLELRQGEIFRIKSGSNFDYLFLIEGGVDVILSGGIASLSSKQKRSKPFVLPATPEVATLLAAEDSIVCHIERDMLDKLLSWDEAVQLHSNDTDNEMYWRMGLIRNCLAFRGLPLEYVERAFQRMDKICIKKGEEVIRQGETADTFYILVSGTAEVWRKCIYTDDMEFVEVVTEGAPIASEALITGKYNNETVKMRENGELLALKKTDFQEIIHKRLVKTVNANIAKTMIDNGYKLLDVRYEEEYEEVNIPNAKLIPLPDLSKRIDELDPGERYITYCHSGNRSEVASMKLAQHNIEALSLEGGIRDWPFDLNANF